MYNGPSAPRTSPTTVVSAAHADVAIINALAAKQKTLIDLMWIPVSS
jgi:hypothetical protein